MKRAVGVLALISLASPCQAEVVWPALLLASRLTTGWAITVGLLVEFLAVWRLLGIPWRRALTVDAAMNAASSIVGAITIPFLGLSIHLFIVAAASDGPDPFGLEPLLWGVPFLLAVLSYAGVEWLVLVKGFRYRAGLRTFWFLAAANFISVAVAALSLRA